MLVARHQPQGQVDRIEKLFEVDGDPRKWQAMMQSIFAHHHVQIQHIGCCRLARLVGTISGAVDGTCRQGCSGGQQPMGNRALIAM